MRAKPPTGSDNRLLRPTAFAQSRHVAVIHGQFGKSPFDRECVVGLGGLELPTKRLSVASSERSVRGPLMGISWLVKCPRWRSYVYKRLVCAKSRLNFTETVSASVCLSTVPTHQRAGAWSREGNQFAHALLRASTSATYSEPSCFSNSMSRWASSPSFLVSFS